MTCSETVKGGEDRMTKINFDIWRNNLVEFALTIHEAAEEVQETTDLPIEQCIELVKIAELGMISSSISDIE